MTFKTVGWGTVSVIARQTGGTLSAYATKHNPLEILYTGTHAADEMFKAEQSKNATLAWILRAVGLVVMWIGLKLVLNPLKVLADVIRFVGDIAGAGIALVTFMLALGLSLVTIAIA